MTPPPRRIRRPRPTARVFTFLAALLAAPASAQLSIGDLAPHARLFGADGASFDAFADGDAKAVALVWFHTACPVARASFPEVASVARDFKGRGVRVYVVDAHDEDPVAVASFVAERAEGTTLAFDRDAVVGRRFGLERVPTAIVVDAARRLRYRGRVFERYTGRDEGAPIIGRLDLRRALESVVEGGAVETPETFAAGCRLPVPFDRAATTPFTFAADVAPILARKCGDCHRVGGSAPMPLLTYRDVRPYVHDVAEVAWDGMMPPWREDGHGVELRGARRLTPTERSVLVRWAQGGAPEGPPSTSTPVDVATRPSRAGTASAAFSVSATLPEVPAFAAPTEVSVEAVFDGPEALSVRAVAATTDADDVVRRIVVRRLSDGALLAVRTPEGPSFEAPPGSAWRLSPGDRLVIEAFYRPQGLVRRPTARLDFFAAEGADVSTPEPRTIVLESVDGVVPAGAPGETRVVERVVDRNVTVVAMFPDLGRHGASAQVEATAPKGKTRRLAGTMHWDPRLRDVWAPTRPFPLSAGTTLRFVAVYDNSETARRRRPGPLRDVAFGADPEDERCRLEVVVVD